MARWSSWLAVAFAWLCSVAQVQAHPSDISHLRVRVEHGQVQFRFSLNVASIARIAVIDANQDNKVVYAEIERAVPAVLAFLKKATLVTINDKDADIGVPGKHECVWPNAETAEVTPLDAAQRFVDFNFTKAWPDGVQDVWLGLQIFEQLGDLHTVQGIYQQEGEHDTPVDFTLQEPEYLYDTGWDGTKMAPAPAALVPVRSAAVSWLAWGIAGAVLACILGVRLMVKRRT